MYKRQYQNNDVAVEMGKNGRNLVLSRFSYEVLEKNLKRMMEKVLNLDVHIGGSLKKRGMLYERS